MEKRSFIYRVAFKEPPIKGDDRIAFYFSSVAAMYELFTPEEMGVALKTLWNNKVADGKPFFGEKVVITRELLYRKANRNSKQSKIS